MSYYEELEQKIKDFIDQEDYSSALKLIEPELNALYTRRLWIALKPV